MPSAAPTANDLFKYLRGAGVMDMPIEDAQRQFDLVGQMAAAINDFERATRYEPFVCAQATVNSVTGPADSTLTFNPWDIENLPMEMPMLDLDGGVLSITTLTVGVTPTSAGTLLTADRDYFLRPAKAPRKGKPYTYIEFFQTNWVIANMFGVAWPNSIVLVGKVGYSLTCPDVAFQGMLARAAANMGPQLSAKFGGLLSWSEADGTKESYGADPFSAFLDRAAAKYQEAVQMFRRFV